MACRGVRVERPVRLVDRCAVMQVHSNFVRLECPQFSDKLLVPLELTVRLVNEAWFDEFINLLQAFCIPNLGRSVAWQDWLVGVRWRGYKISEWLCYRRAKDVLNCLFYCPSCAWRISQATRHGSHYDQGPNYL